MKKFLSVSLALLMIFMTACQSKTKGNNSSSSNTESKVEKTADTNLIKNGDFESGIDNWFTFTQGGKGDISAAGKELEVNIEDVGTLDYSVQIYQDIPELSQGVKYQLTFDARSTVDRSCEARFQLNSGDYHAYTSQVAKLTSTKQTFTIEFEMKEASDPAPRFAINLGLPKDAAGALAAHKVYFDNFCLKAVDSSNKAKAEVNTTLKDININQLGYLPDVKKVAVFRGTVTDKTFDVVDSKTSKVVFTGDISKSFENKSAGETDYYGDFSAFKTEGTYKIKTASLGESYEFEIGNNVYKNVTNDLVKMLYLQRCGIALPKELAKDFAHDKCHSSMATIFGTTTQIDVSGGWHDAGDYGRYVVPGAKTVADLILAYQSNPASFGDNLGIPESNNKVPDVLDEARYELDWMLKMQDQQSGGVHHKVSCANFPGSVMPEKETDPLIVSLVSDAATGDFSAVMAMAYNTYKDIDKTFAEKCLNASKKAWEYLKARDSKFVGFANSTGIVTGEYGDGSLNDEFMWASTELFKITGDDRYHSALKTTYSYSHSDFGWSDVGGYAVNTYLTLPSDKVDSTFSNKLKNDFINKANNILNDSKADGYHISLGKQYPWGSNMTVANNAMCLLLANKISPNPEYVEYAREHMNYIYGTNPMSTSYVTGYGDVSPKHPHHRPSQALKITMPGMLVGGPDSSLEDPYAKAVLKDTPPAKCYVDNEQSYSCNEITIYWNSPLIYLMYNIK